MLLGRGRVTVVAQTYGPGGADDPHGPAVRIAVGGEFAGSGFYAGGGIVVTAAHVVAGRDGAEIGVDDRRGTVKARAYPEAGDGGRFFPYPDLAVLSGTGWEPHPVAVLAAHDPAPGTDVLALGYSTHTPTPGVQPDTLALRVAGRSGAFLRVLGDRIREGFSGSMLVDPAGQVVGVLKGSRSYADALGGWCTPVSALHTLLGTPPLPRPQVPDPPQAPAPPSDADLVDALLAFPALARPEGRYDLQERMGDHLGLPYSFEVDDRPARRDHLYRLVLSCRHFRDERAALRALYTAMEEIVPYDKALERLRELVGRATGQDR